MAICQLLVLPGTGTQYNAPIYGNLQHGGIKVSATMNDNYG